MRISALLYTILALVLGACMAKAQYNAQMQCNPSVRWVDGFCNNPYHPLWGWHTDLLLRPEGFEYYDNKWKAKFRGNERTISNTFFYQPKTPKRHSDLSYQERKTGMYPNDHSWNSLMVCWGQFITHDMVWSPLVSPSNNLKDSYPIPILDQNDLLYEPSIGYTQLFGWSSEGAWVGDDEFWPWNNNTAYLDASTVYGSDRKTSYGLRTFQGGRLKMRDNGLLPFLYDTLSGTDCHNAGPNFHGAGDVRVNENVCITSLHTLFLREHNRLANEIYRAYPQWSDEQIYQEARKFVASYIQHITYYEYLPSLLGPGYQYMPPYSGYKSDIHPGVLNVWTTAAFRNGHDMSNLPLLVIDDKCNVIKGPPIDTPKTGVSAQSVSTQSVASNSTVSVASFSSSYPDGGYDIEKTICVPDFYERAGIEAILRGQIEQWGQQLDHRMDFYLRHVFMYGYGMGHMDIESLHMWRGRYNGVADYYQVRKYYTGDDMYSMKGCARGETQDSIECFLIITKDIAKATALRNIYGKIDLMDAVIGLMLEDVDYNYSWLQPTITKITLKQFQSTRDGDSWWYEWVLKGNDLANVKNTNLATIIKRNSALSYVPDNIFFVPPYQQSYCK